MAGTYIRAGLWLISTPKSPIIDFVTPTTVTLIGDAFEPIFKLFPTASSYPKRSFADTSSKITIFFPSRYSLSLKGLPYTNSIFCIIKPSVLVPVILALLLRVSDTATPCFDILGAIYLTVSTLLLICLMSSKVIESLLEALVPSTEIFIVDEPIFSNSPVMVLCPPCPSATIAITELIPIIIPNIVKKERILFEIILSTAILKFSDKLLIKFIIHTPSIIKFYP
ncbi:hypothetical protein SDC9_163940 [bioreactor metagenome]|uniref:Uncharacterized protein n=1 Tax=bioreactor metagenome TaxID=1076179 RepID=A0A645FQ90_9ZZZZ